MINENYQNILREILNTGYNYEDPNRRGVIRKEVAHATIKTNLVYYNYPLLTIKKIPFNSIAQELCWFLSGSTLLSDLLVYNVNIWNEDAYRIFKQGSSFDISKENFITEVKAGNLDVDLKNIYGKQWRNFNGFDQIYNVVEKMIENPFATDILLSSWNPSKFISEGIALKPCHWSFQIVCYPYRLNNTKKIGFDLIWNQRSVDTYLGLPFNIASYALLMKILGKITGYTPMNLIGNLCNVHLYDNQIDAARSLISRDPKKYDYPTVSLTELWDDYDERLSIQEKVNFISTLCHSDFKLNDYNAYDNIKIKMLTYES